jgi:predicted esterase
MRGSVCGLPCLLFVFAGILSAQDDVADIRSDKIRIGKDPNKTYFLIHPKDDSKPPANGFNLLLVLPGGDGSEAFHPFIKRIFKHALSDEYIAAQLVRAKWTRNQQTIWPHKGAKVPGMKFTTEQFIEGVVKHVKKKYKVNPKHVFTLSWSSGGPAAYAASLQKKKSITGSYIVMSVFYPETLPPLRYAKGYPYYIEHSPEDNRCKFELAKKAKELLTKHKAIVEFSTYSGGHRWPPDVYDRIRKAVKWLEENS